MFSKNPQFAIFVENTRQAFLCVELAFCQRNNKFGLFIKLVLIVNGIQNTCSKLKMEQGKTVSNLHGRFNVERQ